MRLDVHSDIKIISKQEKKMKQQFTHVGVGRKRRGQIMYAYDTDKEEIYIVTPTKKIVFDVTKKREVATYKAIVNPNHPHIYALNMKNAIRKFAKLKIS